MCEGTAAAGVRESANIGRNEFRANTKNACRTDLQNQISISFQERVLAQTATAVYAVAILRTATGLGTASQATHTSRNVEEVMRHIGVLRLLVQWLHEDGCFSRLGGLVPLDGGGDNREFGVGAVVLGKWVGVRAWDHGVDGEGRPSARGWGVAGARL